MSSKDCSGPAMDRDLIMRNQTLHGSAPSTIPRRRLRIYKRSVATWASKGALDRFMKCDDLTISKVILEGSLVKNIISFLEQKTLDAWKCLRLECCTVPDAASEDVRKLWEVIGRSKIQRLEITGDKYEMQNEPEMAATLARLHGGITSICLKGMKVSQSLIAQSIRSNAATLTTVEITECRIDEVGAVDSGSIAQSLQYATNLERLDFSFNQISGSSLDRILCAVPESCPRLAELDLSGCACQVAQQAIADCIMKVSPLRRLYLSSIQTENMAMITEALGRAPTMFRQVTLSCNNIKNEDVVKMLSKLVTSKSSSFIDYLDLRGNRLDSEGLKFMSEEGIISRLPVRTLGIHGNPCDIDGARALLKVLEKPSVHRQRCCVQLPFNCLHLQPGVDYWSHLNADGRHLLREEDRLPVALWPLVLSGATPDSAYFMLHGPAALSRCDYH